MSRIPRLRYKVWQSNKDKELHLLCAIYAHVSRLQLEIAATVRVVRD